jgi:hypothetical protein
LHIQWTSKDIDLCSGRSMRTFPPDLTSTCTLGRGPSIFSSIRAPWLDCRAETGCCRPHSGCQRAHPSRQRVDRKSSRACLDRAHWGRASAKQSLQQRLRAIARVLSSPPDSQHRRSPSDARLARGTHRRNRTVKRTRSTLSRASDTHFLQPKSLDDLK